MTDQISKELRTQMRGWIVTDLARASVLLSQLQAEVAQPGSRGMEELSHALSGISMLIQSHVAKLRLIEEQEKQNAG